VLDLLVVVSDAAAVHRLVRAEAPIGFWRVFAAQASGLAINRLTPANSIGEALKVTMLMAHVPRSTAIAAIVKFNLATLYVALAVIVIGTPLTLLQLDLPARLVLAVWIALGVIVAVGVLLEWLLRRGALATAIAGLARLRVVRPQRAARWRERATGIDASLRQLGHAPRALAWVASSRALHIAGTVLVLRAAHIPLTPPVVLAMASLGIVVTWASNVVPLGIGVADGTNYVLYDALASAPLAGVAFTMVNRTRTCVVAAIGLAVMLLAGLMDRGRPPSEVRLGPDALSGARTK
jgi:hypothetical protein